MEGTLGDGAIANTKEQLRDVIEGLLDDCTVENVQYHLYVQQKVQRGVEDLCTGRVPSLEEVERRRPKIPRGKLDPGRVCDLRK